MFAVPSVKDLGTVNIYVDIWSTKHSRSKMHIWVTPAQAWHFYWGNLTSPHLLYPCKCLLSRNRSWENFGCLFLCCWCCHSTLRPKQRCWVAADSDTIYLLPLLCGAISGTPAVLSLALFLEMLCRLSLLEPRSSGEQQSGVWISEALRNNWYHHFWSAPCSWKVPSVYWGFFGNCFMCLSL